jgi:hypothetical protein
MNQLRGADMRPSRHFVENYEPPKIEGDFTGKHIISVEQFGPAKTCKPCLTPPHPSAAA